MEALSWIKRSNFELVLNTPLFLVHLFLFAWYIQHGNNLQSGTPFLDVIERLKNVPAFILASFFWCFLVNVTPDEKNVSQQLK